MSKHVLYVYGTLRPGGNEVHHIPGVMYELGWFPGVKLGLPESGDFFVAERIEVDDDRLLALDRYEGHDRAKPEASFFRRVPYRDGQIYVYNDHVNGYDRIKDGDWLKFREEECGISAAKVSDIVEENAA